MGKDKNEKTAYEIARFAACASATLNLNLWEVLSEIVAACALGDMKLRSQLYRDAYEILYEMRKKIPVHIPPPPWIYK